MPANPNAVDAPTTTSSRWFWVFVALVVGLGWYGSKLMGRMFDSTLSYGRPPVLAKVEMDFTASDRDGRQVQFSQLNGKVRVVGYIYTICPHGCAAVIAEMKKLLEKHGTRQDFHLVSVTVVPDRDTPALLKSYAEGLGVKPADPWWFLNGDRLEIDHFMSASLRLSPSKLIPEDQRMNPLDIYEHDLRLSVVDRLGQVRGHYHVAHPQPEIAEMARTKLQQQVSQLLNNPSL